MSNTEAQPTGGSPEHLLQDKSRDLSRALAGKPDARLHAKEAAAALGRSIASDAPDDAHPLYQRGWKAGYKHGAWQTQHCVQPAASGEPVATVRRAHAGGRVRSIGHQVCDLLPGANVQDGTMLYAAPQPTPAPAASVEPVAWHMRVIGCDGSADWCELGAAPPEPVQGVEALPLVYAAPQPAPDAALRIAVRLVLDATPDQLPLALDALRDHAATAQPAPARVPLTDSEVDELARTMVKGNKSVNWLCRAIEAAHGITAKAKP